MTEHCPSFLHLKSGPFEPAVLAAWWALRKKARQLRQVIPEITLQEYFQAFAFLDESFLPTLDFQGRVS